MNFEDFILSPPKIKFEKGQLGSLFVEDLPENGIAILVVSDYRGNDFDGNTSDATGFREQFYRLSASDFTMPIYDFGDLISGKTQQDTHYILQEVLSTCHYKNTIPVVIGGSLDLSFSMFSALNFHQKNINFTQISNTISLTDLGEELNEKNYLSRIFSSKNFSLKNFSLLGYQKHLNDDYTVQLIKDVDFETCRLSEMIKNVQDMEPFFRRTHFASVNANAIESFGRPFSVYPQVNGLNRREICAYMKEIGMSENLQSLGIFNLALDTNSILNNQLLAQMLWYTIEGISIQKSHPKEKKLDTFYVMIDEEQYTFKCDVFSKLWYFGDSEKIENLIPCSYSDYENAKKGNLNTRLLKILNS